MKTLLLTTALMMCSAAFNFAHALEATATDSDPGDARAKIDVVANSALVTAAISKVNKDVTSILRCNKLNKFYKPADGTADANGCVGISVTTATTNHTDNLPNVLFNTYPGSSKNKKGYIGTSTRTIDLSSIVASGAKSISVNGALSGFTGGCSGVAGSKTWNIANVNTSVAATQYQCHYDSSPNRSTYFTWSYNASTKALTVSARMSQTNSPMTSARISGITAAYQLTKTVLKIGDGN